MKTLHPYEKLWQTNIMRGCDSKETDPIVKSTASQISLHWFIKIRLHWILSSSIKQFQGRKQKRYHKIFIFKLTQISDCNSHKSMIHSHTGTDGPRGSDGSPISSKLIFFKKNRNYGKSRWLQTPQINSLLNLSQSQCFLKCWHSVVNKIENLATPGHPREWGQTLPTLIFT